MELGLEGRVAVVTGASRGIGLAISRRFVQEGAQVVGVARSAPVERVAGTLHLEADLLEEETPEAVVELAIASYGRLDILVNNAGGGNLRSGYDGVSAGDWRGAFESLFLIHARLTAVALPRLAEARGTVVNVISRAAHAPATRAPDYSAAKAALANYSQGLAQELAPARVRVVSVSPGTVATPAVLGPDGIAAQAAALTEREVDAVVQEMTESVPLGRLVEPSEVADLVVFLASERAAMISGVDIAIDGGLARLG